MKKDRNQEKETYLQVLNILFEDQLRPETCTGEMYLIGALIVQAARDKDIKFFKSPVFRWYVSEFGYDPDKVQRKWLKTIGNMI